MRVLIVEDEVKLAALIRRGLRDEGMLADVAVRGEDALWMAGSTAYDAIVLDVMLPGVDGFEVCRRLRRDGVWSPVLMLTARDAVEDRVAGLGGGADGPPATRWGSAWPAGRGAPTTPSSSRSRSRSSSRGCERSCGGARSSARACCR